MVQYIGYSCDHYQSIDKIWKSIADQWCPFVTVRTKDTDNGIDNDVQAWNGVTIYPVYDRSDLGVYILSCLTLNMLKEHIQNMTWYDTLISFNFNVFISSCKYM